MSLDEKLKKYRISQTEYDLICEKLGRKPQGVEWALFSALWSEHCSYKSSRKHLKELYRDAPHVLESFGENAGVLDIGDGEKIAFKMESHNHPSFIEPYQGAATGVGGILRDIFTMGARPIALANYLCFGEPEAPRMTELVDGVVKGIGGYGNCVGVPNITGKTYFDPSYNENILVNAFALGYFAKGDKVFLSKGQKPGQRVIYVGARTGRDGIHGASMASESFEEGDESKRPTIQIGDPFYEKLLIESCLEVMGKDLVTSIQDMGAAGITSSSFEMASKSGLGLEIHLDRVPLRDSSLTPEDILLSESQERMLLMCEESKVQELQDIFSKWDLEASDIGEVIENKNVRLFWNSEVVADIDPDLLVEEAPIYERPYNDWKPKNRVSKEELQPRTLSPLKTAGLVNECDRSWIYEQYDQRVGAKTESDCSNTVGALRLEDTSKSLAISLGCRPSLMQFDAKEGGRDSVFFPALKLAAKGFTPIGLTDCLNFGNPEKPEIMSEFVASLNGMNEACKELECPIISGNVSFYNETQGRNITSTPATGVVGLKNHLQLLPKDNFQEEGNTLFLLETDQLTLNIPDPDNPLEPQKGFGEINADALRDFILKVQDASHFPGVVATRVVGQFGLPHTLMKMCLGGKGAKISLLADDPRLTYEKLYQVVFEVKSEAIEDFKKKYQPLLLGSVHKDTLILPQEEIAVDSLQSAYKDGWRLHFEDLA